MGRFGKQLVCILTLLVMSSPALAEWHHIPQWQRKEIQGQMWACYDFEDAKRLKQLDNHVDALTEAVVASSSTADNLTQIVVAQQYLLELHEGQSIRDQRKLALLATRAVTAETKVTELKDRDVLGGGWVWGLVVGIVGAAVGAAVGGVTVYAVTKD